jgi:16S rRNA (guanine966-N2)-methyltransferase
MLGFPTIYRILTGTKYQKRGRISVRIISGTARGKRLAGFSGSQIRPTSDRVREAIFSILTSRLGTFENLKILDLFAGTGALGLEALSRGAGSAYMLDYGSQSARLVTANAKTCNLQEKVSFRRGDVLKKLPEMTAFGPFDLIFLDPPYRQGLAEETLKAVAGLGLLTGGGIVCAETSSGEDLPEQISQLNCTFRRRYGSTLITLYS